MSRFYGQLIGKDFTQSVTRCGRYFMRSSCSSWRATVCVELYVDPLTHEECARIRVMSGTLRGPIRADDWPKHGYVILDTPIDSLVQRAAKKRGVFKHAEKAAIRHE